jgi:hypothetical protein
VFDFPPFNIVDATIFEGLQDLLLRDGHQPESACRGVRERES